MFFRSRPFACHPGHDKVTLWHPNLTAKRFQELAVYIYVQINYLQNMRSFVNCKLYLTPISFQTSRTARHLQQPSTEIFKMRIGSTDR